MLILNTCNLLHIVHAGLSITAIEHAIQTNFLLLNYDYLIWKQFNWTCYIC